MRTCKEGYRNMKKRSIYIGIFLGLLFFLFLAIPVSVYAQDTSMRIELDEMVMKKGYRATFYDSNFIVNIPPDVYASTSTIVLSLAAWQSVVPRELASDPSLEFASNVYTYDVVGARMGDIKKEFGIQIRPKKTSQSASLYFFDKHKNHWERLQSRREKDGSYTARARFPFVHVAILQERKWIEKGVINAVAMPARAVGVADGKGSFLFTKNAYEQLSLASLTKLMTVLVFLDKNPGWQKIVQITAQDDAEPAKIAFQIGDKAYVKDLFYATLIGSKNNAAKALARATGLSHEEFIKKMNEKAMALGMKQTIFVDVTGLDAGNRSTIEDSLKLSRAAFGNLNIAKAASMKTYTFRIIGTKRQQTVKSTNFLLADVGLSAMGKTGYINESGYNFATRVKNKKQEILVVVLGATSGEKREEITEELIQFGFRQLAIAQNKKAKKT